MTSLESESGGGGINLDDILKRLKALENDKVDCDLFDNEIAGLRAMIGNSEPDAPKTENAP